MSMTAISATVEIIWATHNQYIIVRDVHEKWHERVRNFMLEKYFIPHRLFNHLKYQEDPEVNTQYQKYVEHILRDECSIIVMHKDTEEIYGVALLKCMTKEFRSWTCLQYCIDESMFTDIVELQYRTIHEYAAENPDKLYNSLHIFEYYLEDLLKYDREFLKKFFDAIYGTAKYLKMQRITFLALTEAEQLESYAQGYERVARAIYSLFILQKKRRPFAPLRHIQETEAGLFETVVDTLVPYTKIILRNPQYLETGKPKKKSSVTLAV